MPGKAPLFGILMLFTAVAAFAQIAPNNNYAQMLTNTNAMMQLSLSQTIASQAATNARANASGTSRPTCDPLPPPDLQRGVDGHVPPELQGDPRYQAWLRCRQGQGVPQASGGTNPLQASAGVSGGYYPTPVVQYHLPMTATDFTPVVQGHPILEQFLTSQPFTPQQRAQLRQAFMEMSVRVAGAARPNNLAASMASAVCGAIYTLDKRFTDADSDRYLLAINDRLGSSPKFANMSALQKQNLSDSLILQTTVIKLLSQLGDTNPQARSQSAQFSHTVLQQLTGSPVGRLSF